jgi:diguanylate cyclase
MDSKQLYKAIGDFLAAHGLWPTPDNYALVYQLIADENSAQAQAVKAATSDGIRLSQREADRIKSEHGMAVAPCPGGIDPAILAAANQRMEEFAAIVESSRAQAQSYGRDLAAGAENLEKAGDEGSVATLVAITRAMAERTKEAEAELTAARDEAETLKVKLAEAGEEARSDPLTRLPNRRAFEEKLADVARDGIAASLAICDIDHFKRINDSYGHAVGDRVLRLVADLLDANCPGHFVARLGGEEFVVLFEGMDAAESALVLDEARVTLAAKHFRLRETDAPIGQITFSAGIACGEGPGGEPPLHRADVLLYEAKNGGRNQIRFEGCQ